MCGIFGIISLDGSSSVDKIRVERGLELMRHRGPDDDGIHVDTHTGRTRAVIGMRRLSIIDIAHGHQPVYNESRDIAVVFNGEIYNYRELRTQLESKGHRFTTQSDTEVIVHLYEERGPDCVKLLNGMFAFAVWDSRDGSLFLGRDRMGVKPLYYSVAAGQLIFSSELRAIVSDPSVSRAIDDAAMAEYFSFYYISSPRTIYRDVRRFPQAHTMSVRGGKIELSAYWHYTAKPEPWTENDAAAAIRTAFERSVKRQLNSEVPLGVFLSSGLDSTSIAAAMSRAGEKIRTYTIGYENGNTYNELSEARMVAEAYHTDHHDCIMGPAAIAENLPRMIWQLAEPHGDWTQVALHHLSGRSKQDITVVLAGMGGDELFAGYPTLTAAKAARYYRMMPAALRAMVRTAANALPSSYNRLSFDFKAKSFVAGAEFPPEQAHMRYKEIYSAEERNALFLYTISGYDPYDVFRQHLPACRDAGELDRLMYLDMNVFLPYCALQVTDMATMLNSQECRVPFLDNEMIDLSERIPVSLKLRGITTKYILRKAFGEWLPPAVLKLPKKGLAMPTAYWLQKELAPFIDDIFGQAEPRLKDMLNFDYIRRLRGEHTEGKRDHTRRLTCLISFCIWHLQYQA